jgi:hypothetical protein
LLHLSARRKFHWVEKTSKVFVEVMAPDRTLTRAPMLASACFCHRVQINPSSIVTLVVISQFERQPVEAGQPARSQWAAAGASQASRKYHRPSLVHHRHGSRRL